MNIESEIRRALLLSPYDTGSHRYWSTGVTRHCSGFLWDVKTLPARYFSWRIRGNSLTWGCASDNQWQGPYDLLLATSMTDLASLRGFLPWLADVPTVLYFHENQFAYPKSHRQHPSIEPQVVSVYAALCADKLAFNSTFNRDTFLQGAEHLLAGMPDCVPSGLVERLRVNSVVLPVPLQPPTCSEPVEPAENGPLTLLWNHRWEYDKGPDRLLRAVSALPIDWDLRFHVVGPQFRSSPEEFELLKRLLRDRGWLGQWGYVEQREDYHRIMYESDVVLSTAYHEFQGLAVQEAVAAGCIPLVTDGLAYPEWFAAHYRIDWENQSAVQRRFAALLDGKRRGESPLTIPQDIRLHTWDAMATEYSNLFDEVVEARR